jgi:hypothetical protein
MEHFVSFLFYVCVGLMTGLGNLFHVSYMTINVILFCYVEPIFTGIMVSLAVMSLCGLPVNVGGIWFFRIVVALVVILLLAGGFYFVGQGIATEYGLYNEPYLHMPYETSAHAAKLFGQTVAWLNKTAATFGTTYQIINLVVYVLAMPALCIASYVILRIKHSI